MISSEEIVGIPADVAAVTREYIVRVRVVVPETLNMAELDAAMSDVLDNEGAAESIEDALYHEFNDLVGEAFEDLDARFGVISFEVDAHD
jgi:hypothetical protein